MMRVCFITIDKVYGQRMFVTVTHHGHRSGVYTCIFLHGSVGYFLVPGSCRIRKYIGITRSNASRFQEFSRNPLRFFVTCHYFIRTSRNTLCHIRSPFYKKFHLQHSSVARRPCFGKSYPLFCQVEFEYPARFVLQIIKIGLILQTGLRHSFRVRSAFSVEFGISSVLP